MKMIRSSITVLLTVSVFLLALTHCGSDSGGSLVLFGKLQQAGTINNTMRTDGGMVPVQPIQGAIIEGLGQSTRTGEDGNYFLTGDTNSIPDETVLFITLPTTRNTRETVVVDTSLGDAPIEVNLTRDQNGNYTFTLSGGGEQESGVINPTPEPTTDPEDLFAPLPEDTGSPTPTPLPDECDSFENDIGGLNSSCTESRPYCTLGNLCVECLENANCESGVECVLNSCFAVTPSPEPTATVEPTVEPTSDPILDVPVINTGNVLIGTDSCGVGNFNVSSGGALNLGISDFGTNNPFEVDFTGTDIFDADGLIILDAPQHTCSFQFNGNSAMVSCTNPQGGFCQSMGTFGDPVCDPSAALLDESEAFATCP